jgi:hypothetical protein
MHQRRLRPGLADRGNLCAVSQQGTNWFNATYNGDRLRGAKQGFCTPWQNYTWRLGGVLADTNDRQPSGSPNHTVVSTPGVSQL